ncbi:contactin-3-like [Stylophora pistillata]|uniref:contactin-3-like n=1 Tax=Stylophora pistillata TaxID=50429 RepID=UPI000C040671|nr:contactin-3-like [Stylophora pistillata]
MPWTHCKKPCNNGTRTRRRTCDNPSPAFGGNNCEGLPTETEPCNQNKCPAESVNYQVKLRSEGWKDSLANSSSKDYKKLVDRVKKAVNDSYYRRDEVEVVILKFWKGSVYSSFNVTYQSIDSLQIVSLLEEIAEGTLRHIFAELLNITTSHVPQEAPRILEAKSTTSTSINLTWTNVSEHSSLKGYLIVYKEVGKKFHTNTMKSVVPNQSNTVLEDLKMFKNYSIRVFAFTSSGNGVPSDAVNVRTQEDVPSEPPPDSVVKSTSSSTINVSWGPISPAFIHGILVGYEVRYAKDAEAPEWENKTVDADTHETVLSDLEYFTPYQVVICAGTSKGCGKNVSHSATTFGDEPSKPPQNVTAEKLKAAESINVTWNEVPFGHVNGLLMGYSIKYRRVKTAEVNVVHSVEETAVAKSNDLWIVLSVQSYSVYAIRVAAFTQKGLGPYSEYEYGETCRCPKTLYTNYWSTPPYLKVNQEDNTLEGIFGHIVTDMIYTACGECPAYGSTEIDITSNGNKQPSGKESLVDVLGDIKDVPQISFPIYGNKYVTRFGGIHAYVNLVESPGLAFVAAKRIPGAAATNMIHAVFSCFPLVILSACMSFISGFIIWLLDTKNNPGEFPTSFRKGVGEGFWWSFISMTTVGYGDRSPRSVPARMFGIAWTLTGLVIISILVGAIQNSTEHRIGILKNARVNEENNYKNLEQIRTALENGEIEGALIDTYVAAEHKDELFNDKIYVKEILDRPFGYGVVLSGAAVNVEQRCRDYINQHKSYIFHMIPNSTKTLDVSEINF